MNKKPIIIISLVILAGLGLLVFQNSKKAGDFNQRLVVAESSTQASSESEVALDLSNYSFKPDIIKVKKGTRVTWTNKDSTKHSVTSDSGTFIDSPLIDRGQTYQKIFDKTGTYKYHCKPHPNMIAAVIVID